MGDVRPYGIQIDFVSNSISESAACFFIIILKFVFTLIFVMDIDEKNTWHRKNKIIFEDWFS